MTCRRPHQPSWCVNLYGSSWRCTPTWYFYFWPTTRTRSVGALSLSDLALHLQMVNRSLRIEKKAGAHDPNVLLYPLNVTLSNYFYFLWAPTLVYQINYPRTKKIRLRYFPSVFLCLQRRSIKSAVLNRAVLSSRAFWRLLQQSFIPTPSL